LIGLLHPDEVESLTGAMHVFEERMGYIVRKSQVQKRRPAQGDEATSEPTLPDLLADLGPPIGRNIRLDFDDDDQREDVIDDLKALTKAARVAREAINRIFPPNPSLALSRPSKQALPH
jgi:hypothetical protein